MVGVFVLFWAMDQLVDVLPGRLARGGAALRVRGSGPRRPVGVPVYPVVNTILISFKDAQGNDFVGLDNYEFVFTDESMLRSLRNTGALDRARARSWP